MRNKLQSLCVCGLLLLAATASARSHSGIVTVAHRGGIIPGYPENTLASYRHAIELGAQVIEVDLRGTSDGAIVVMHDATVDRTTNGHGSVSEHPLAWLKSLDAGKGERIPDYGEVLDCMNGSGVLLLLDIKESSRLDTAGVMALTCKRNALLKVIIGARSVADVRRFKNLNPNVRVLGFVNTPDEIDAFVQAGADIIRIWPEWLADKPALVGEVHALGKPVWITAGEAGLDGMDAFADAGVDGILSDYPQVLREFNRDSEVGKAP